MAFWNNKDTLVNPVVKFLDWKGKDSDGYFTYWDNESKENIKFDFNKFVIVDLWYTIKWYSNTREKWIYSNEIKHFGSKLRVMESGDRWLTVCEWIYKDIKDTIEAEWAKLHMWVTVMNLNTGELMEFFVKWNAYFNFNTNIVKEVQRVQWEWNPVVIEYTGAELVKGKAFNYNEPTFKVTEEIIGDDNMDTFNKYCEDVDTYYSKLKDKYKDDSVDPQESHPEWEYAKPAWVESDEEFAETVKKENKIKDGNKPVDEMSIEEIPF